MKHLFLSIFILAFAVSESPAQWQLFPFDNPAVFGFHNDSLFASRQGGDVYRYAPTTPDRWVISDTGLAPGSADKAVTCFGSIGTILLAAANGTSGTAYIAVFRSTNNGSSWAISKNIIQSNAFATVGDTIYAGGGGGVYRSTDSGLHWASLTASPHGVNALAVLGTTLFAGTNAGVYFSIDNGNNWTRTSFATITSELCVMGSIIFAGTGGAGVSISQDGGTTWTAVNKGLFNHYVNSLVTDGKNLFAGTGVQSVNGSYGFGSGVFLSTDSGSSWDTVNTGFPEGIDGSLNISTLFIFDTIVIAGTWDNAGQIARSYARPISGMVPKDAIAIAPQAAPVSLSAYPNPLSNLTTIAYSIPEESEVSLTICDALGRNVAVPIADIHQSAGEHQVDFDASRLVPGIYWCEFFAGTAKQFLKLSIEK